jgi:hypothetical protein
VPGRDEGFDGGKRRLRDRPSTHSPCLAAYVASRLRVRRLFSSGRGRPHPSTTMRVRIGTAASPRSACRMTRPVAQLRRSGSSSNRSSSSVGVANVPAGRAFKAEPIWGTHVKARSSRGRAGSLRASASWLRTASVTERGSPLARLR